MICAQCSYLDISTIREKKLNEKNYVDVDLLFWSNGIQLHWVRAHAFKVVLIHFEALFSVLYFWSFRLLCFFRLCLFQQNVDCLLLVATKVMHFMKWQATNNRHKKISQFHRKFHFNGIKCKPNEHTAILTAFRCGITTLDNLGTIRKYQFDCLERIQKKQRQLTQMLDASNRKHSAVDMVSMQSMWWKPTEPFMEIFQSNEFELEMQWICFYSSWYLRCIW